MRIERTIEPCAALKSATCNSVKSVQLIPLFMASPLRLAILWHQHQPYYKSEGEYLLPWTRLHATKDYREMATALERFPDVRATVNVVPSLLLQLQDYAENGAPDKVLRISRIPATELSPDDKAYILRQFFLCNVERMVLPHKRYAELYRAVHSADGKITPEKVNRFSTQDWLDIQTWYALTWIGEYALEEEPFARLMKKGKEFTETEKQELLDASLKIVGDVIPTYRRLTGTGQVELSVTPFYHPILPLLCNSFAALEAMPNATLPTHRIAWRDDAGTQIARAVEFFRDTFGAAPQGMWPSEGSVSTDALELIRENGLHWAASDEEIIRRTLGGNAEQLPHCFPWQVKTPAGPIDMVFRDREMSDAIGFVYAGIDPEEAAQDFIGKALHRREQILAFHGEEGLAQAMLPVILDGENCWEYYEKNGRPFLEALYRLLSETEELRTVTVSEGLAEIGAHTKRTLGRIAAGSWIGGNFKIWMGHQEDNTAWDLLADARSALLEARGAIPEEQFRNAYEEILIAEGSDWFWWYGDENTSANQEDFDRLFREHLHNVYRLIERPAPETLNTPIHHVEQVPKVLPPSGPICPSTTGLRSSAGEWNHAGHFRVKAHGGAMHRGEISEGQVLYGTDGIHFFLRYDQGTTPDPEHGIRILLKGNHAVEFGCRSGQIYLAAGRSVPLESISLRMEETLDASLPLALLTESGSASGGIELIVELLAGETLTERIPHEETLLLEL